MQAVAVEAKAWLRKRSPSRRSAARAVMSEMQLRANAGCCHASNRLRLQAVAVEAKARLRKWSPEGGVKRLANAVRHAAGCECRLAALETTGYGRRLLP